MSSFNKVRAWGALGSFILGLCAAASVLAAPLGTAFTYQGQLRQAGALSNGSFDFQFSVFDAATGGIPVGGAVTLDNVLVVDGLFTVELDFGTVFGGQKVFLQVGVRDGSSSGAFTPLTPLRELTPAPHALFTPFSGNTGLLDGLDSTAFATAAHGHDASNVTSGTLNDLRLSSNVFLLDQNEVVSGRPAFNGGTNGVSSPFSVDSTVAVTNLNADLLDGLSSSAFATGVHNHDANDVATGTLNDLRLSSNVFLLDQNENVTGRPSFNGGTTGATAPFAVDSTDVVVNLNADQLDGLSAGSFNRKLNRVALVATGPAPLTSEVGYYNTPQAAMTDLAAWCGTPDASNPCLIKIMPGTYTVTAASPLQMREFVDIEGSGKDVTVLTRDNAGTSNGVTLQGAVNNTPGGPDSAVRSLTIRGTVAASNLGASAFQALGGSNQEGARFEDVNVVMTGSASCTGGCTMAGIQLIGFPTVGSVLRNTAISITITGTSNSNFEGMVNSTNAAATTILRDSSITVSATNAARAQGINGFGGGAIDANRIQVDVTGSGTTAAVEAVRTNAALISNSVIEVSASASATQVSAVFALGATTIRNTDITALQDTANLGRGIQTSINGTFGVTIDHSRIVTDGPTINHQANGLFLIGNTLLSGGTIVGSGPRTCAGTYDEAYAFFASTCP